MARGIENRYRNSAVPSHRLPVIGYIAVMLLVWVPVVLFLAQRYIPW